MFTLIAVFFIAQYRNIQRTITSVHEYSLLRLVWTHCINTFLPQHPKKVLSNVLMISSNQVYLLGNVQFRNVYQYSTYTFLIFFRSTKNNNLSALTHWCLELTWTNVVWTYNTMKMTFKSRVYSQNI